MRDASRFSVKKLRIMNYPMYRAVCAVVMCRRSGLDGEGYASLNLD